MKIQAIRTSVFRLGQPLLPFMIESMEGALSGKKLPEGSVLAVTSKIASLAENRVVPLGSTSKEALVKSECEHYLGEGGFGTHLTIHHGLLIPSAGIDESNSELGHYILFPKDPMKTAHDLWLGLRDHFQVRTLGVILTDSHTHPLRRGVTGIGLAHAGFNACPSQVGKPDLFGRKMKMTHINALDALAVSAVYLMGETAECQPLALIEDAPVQFQENVNVQEIRIPLRDDLYFPVLEPCLTKK